MRPAAALFAAVLCARAADFDHSALDKVLEAHVNAIGEVDYAAIKRDRAGLDGYVQRVGEVSPDNRKDLFSTRDHELAYWLNAYNALMLRMVANAYPIKTVRELGSALTLGYGVFLRKEHVLGGVKMSFRSLENDIIRARYSDARIHFAIVCASLSCPFLDRKAFNGAALDAQLDRLTRDAIAQRRTVAIDPARNQLTLSALFNWYDDDFGNTLEFIRRYAPDKDRKTLQAMTRPKIRYHDYDWSINDPGSRARAKSEFERELARRRP